MKLALVFALLFVVCASTAEAKFKKPLVISNADADTLNKILRPENAGNAEDAAMTERARKEAEERAKQSIACGAACQAASTDEASQLGDRLASIMGETDDACKECRANQQAGEQLAAQVAEQETAAAQQRAESLQTEITTLQRLVSHAADIGNAIPEKQKRLAMLKSRLQVAAEGAVEQEASVDLTKQQDLLLEVNAKIEELKMKLGELEATKVKIEKEIAKLEAQAATGPGEGEGGLPVSAGEGEAATAAVSSGEGSGEGEGEGEGEAAF